MARAIKTRSVHWCVVSMHGEGLRLMDHDDSMACSSWEDAIGYLAGRCNAVGIWPESFKLHDEKATLELFFQEKAFAAIRELAPASGPLESQVQRAKSTITGVRDEQEWLLELHKRLKRWPGLEHIGLSSDFPENDACKHLPIPSEWLGRAKRLGRLSGMDAVDTKKAQEIAAAVFDEPSWHHLCALASDESGAAPWEAVSGPWRACVSANGEPIDSIFCASPYDALRNFVHLASQEISIDSTLEFRFSATSGSDHMPCLHIESPREPGKIPFISVDFSKIPVTSADDSVIKEFSINLENGLHDCVSRVFGISMPSGDRLVKRDALLNRELLIQDGRWRFSMDARKMIAAEELDEHGHVLRQALIPTHKGGIYWHPDLEAHVLTYDYDGKRPVAILRDIHQQTVAALLKHLHEAVSSRDAEDWHLKLSDEDRSSLNFLEQNGARNA